MPLKSIYIYYFCYNLLCFLADTNGPATLAACTVVTLVSSALLLSLSVCVRRASSVCIVSDRVI